METFVGDTVKIILNTYTDVSAFGTLRIYYRKPSGTTGYWTAAICPTDNNKIQRSVLTSYLDENGTWKVQAFVQQGTEKYHGKWAEMKVYTPITTEPPTTAPPTTAPPTTLPPTT